MSELVRFFVNGCPVPKQSFRMGKHGGYTDPRVTEWSSTVQAEAMRYILHKVEGNVFIKLSFFMPDKRRVDLDNLAKNVMDSVKNICFGDDSDVTTLHVTKCVNKETPGVLVAIGDDKE